MARAEYQGCPPGVVRGAAAHPSIASALNHTVRLPRRRRLASYAGQFVTLCVRLGMRWRRSWFSLKGKAGILGQVRGSLLRQAGFERHRAGPCTKAALGRVDVDLAEAVPVVVTCVLAAGVADRLVAVAPLVQSAVD